MSSHFSGTARLYEESLHYNMIMHIQNETSAEKKNPHECRKIYNRKIVCSVCVAMLTYETMRGYISRVIACCIGHLWINCPSRKHNEHNYNSVLL